LVGKGISQSERGWRTRAGVQHWAVGVDREGGFERVKWMPFWLN